MSDTLIDFSGPSEKTPYICIHTEPAVIGTRRSDQSLCADCVFSLVEESWVRGGAETSFMLEMPKLTIRSTHCRENVVTQG